jgi:hypothetical protein
MMDDLVSRRAATDTALEFIVEYLGGAFDENLQKKLLDRMLELPSAEPEHLTDEDFETIRIHLNAYKGQLCNQHRWKEAEEYQRIIDRFISFASAQPDENKYEYHYDHTDCIWYRPEARNRCPATCAQYRDGWNDAMNYIFRDGKGYRPYRRDKQYEK